MFSITLKKWLLVTACTLLASSGALAQTKPNVVILATGGTIAGAGADRYRQSDVWQQLLVGL